MLTDLWTIASQQYIERGSLAAAGSCSCVSSGILGLEIVTYQMRAKTWAFVLLPIQVTSIFGGYVNPIGLENIGRKFDIYNCAWVFIVFLIVYFFFVETQEPTPEELACLFEGNDTKTQMTQKWEAQVDSTPEHHEEAKGVV